MEAIQTLKCAGEICYFDTCLQERISYGISYEIVVVDQEYLWLSLFHRQVQLACFLFGSRDGDYEFRAFSRGVFKADSATGSVDNLFGDAEAKARSLIVGLGGEERFKDLFGILRINASAVV